MENYFTFPSAGEVDGKSSSAYPQEEGITPFDYYITEENRYKHTKGSTSNYSYWTRTPSLYIPTGSTSDKDKYWVTSPGIGCFSVTQKRWMSPFGCL